MARFLSSGASKRHEAEAIVFSTQWLGGEIARYRVGDRRQMHHSWR